MQQNKNSGRNNSISQGLLQTIHPGFNYFHEIKFPAFNAKKRNRMKTLQPQNSTMKKSSPRNFNVQKYLSSTISDNQENEVTHTLQENKFRLEKLKTEVHQMRQAEFNQYIKKSIRYQGLLDINDNKKKRLPTLNAKIGEIIKKNISDNNNKHYMYDAHFTSIKLQGWKPESRQGHTLILYKDSVIMIGGHCSHPFPKANIYSIEKNTWVKVIDTPTARSYHTSIIYKNNYIITFGGMGVYNASRKCRECFNSISLIDLKTQSSKIIKMINEESVEPRRSHSATLMGKYMVIFGGMNTKKEFLNDLVYLDIKDLRWSHKEYKIESKELEAYLGSGLAKHQAVMHFRPRKSYPFYHVDYTEQQGIYFFGGANQEGHPNTVMQMTFTRYVPWMKRVMFSGKAPSHIDPVIEKYNDQSILIVSGDQYQREVNIFNFKEHKFTNVNVGFKPCLGGLGSAMVLHKENYYVFYGLGKEGYIGTINRFLIEEKVEEIESKKKKEKIHEEWKKIIGNNEIRSNDSFEIY